MGYYLDAAIQISEQITHELTPYTDRLLVVGGIRRELDVVQCIEVLVLPALDEIETQSAMFEGLADTMYNNLFFAWHASLPTQLNSAELNSTQPNSAWTRHNSGEPPPPPPPHAMLAGYTHNLLYKYDSGHPPIPVAIYQIDYPQQWGIGAIISTGGCWNAEQYYRMVSMRGFSLWNLVLHEHTNRPRRSGGCNPLDCTQLADTDTEEKAYAVIGMPFVDPDDRDKKCMRELEKSALGFTESARY